MYAYDPDELADDQFDAVLDHVGAELLEHVRATTDPAATLLALIGVRDRHIPDTVEGVDDESYLDGAVTMITARSRARVLASMLGAVRSRAHDGDNAVRARHLARGLAEVLGCDRVLALDRESDTDLTRALDRALALARALERALDERGPVRADDNDPSDRDLTRAWSLAQGHRLALDLARAIDLDVKLARYLDAVTVDASGVDLSHLDLDDLTVLGGVVWTDMTVWPEEWADLIWAHSTPIGAGVYQVADRTDLERAASAPV